ncbi:hypothetical protein [Archaeoglobus profundus]|uniref:Uncharacterized protein n=1 Tax=Archaeoglobus profundus (strain DSM 5631 / JCM 9629 / NBRC 100127 / Av18) TaxID=572546 RepID=D2RE99_ARCPA|nr:hypothetical protein [Archaeoglobus profundus]ADB58443.1 hypothetical protein Arcpr_1394 [Archaeoglobus profundus DSM 5631]
MAIEREILKDVKSKLTGSDKLFLFNAISDYIFKGMDIKKKLEVFAECRFPSVKEFVLNWLTTSLFENDLNYDAWIN